MTAQVLLSNVDAVAEPGDTSKEGVSFTHLDEPLFDGAAAKKGDLVDYLDGVANRILPELRDRPL